MDERTSHGHEREAGPLVSCIMPTYDRARFVPKAIEYFLRQDYPAKELVIVDDGRESVRHLIPAHESINYIHIEQRLNVGLKRNLACQHARGELIAHWDDDDWYAAHRLSIQVAALRESGARICGLRDLLYFDLRHGRGFKYLHGQATRWLSLLCYQRSLWEELKFPDRRMGEDTTFVRRVPGAAVRVLTEIELNVCMIHGSNVAPKNTAGTHWKPVPEQQIRDALGADWEFYAQRKWPAPPASDSPRAPRIARQPRPPAAKIAAVGPASGVRMRRGLELSIVLPAHAAAGPLLERSLAALELQTLDPEHFEVVVAADGGDAQGVLARAVAAERRRYDCRLIESARPCGDIAHRNHARNAGCEHARGRLLWVLDADFLLPQHALEHLLAEHDAALLRGRPALFTPCLGTIALGPEAWLTESAAFAREPSAEAYAALLRALPIRDREYSGFFARRRPSATPVSEPTAALREGFPTCWASVWRALGRYDETFVGYGGNKEEYARRLVALCREADVEIRILSSVLALHQPHAPDPTQSASSPLRARNTRYFRARLHGIQTNAPWWRTAVAASRTALAALPVELGYVDCVAAPTDAR